MFAFLLSALINGEEIQAHVATEARIRNSQEFREAKLSINELPLDFPEGTATMELGVSASGKMTSCRMIAWGAAGPPDPQIESSICSELRRVARFDAARDASGKPVDSILEVGIDPALPNEPALTTLDGLFSADDYPMSALRVGAAGSVTARLTIDAKGKVTRCDVVRSSKNAALDSMTCDVLSRRAKFTPGKGDGGRSLGGTILQTVRWQTPDRRPFQDMVLRSTVRFDADGKMVECESYWSDAELKKDACEQLRAVAFKALTPVQRAFRNLSKEEGFLIGPRQVAEQVGLHRGEDRLAMLAAFVAINERGEVASCEPVDAADKQNIAILCDSARQTKFGLDEEDGAKAGRTAVYYTAIVLRRPGA